MKSQKKIAVILLIVMFLEKITGDQIGLIFTGFIYISVIMFLIDLSNK